MPKIYFKTERLFKIESLKTHPSKPIWGGVGGLKTSSLHLDYQIPNVSS